MARSAQQRKILHFNLLLVSPGPSSAYMLFKNILPLKKQQLEVGKADGQNKLETEYQPCLRSSPLADLSGSTSQSVVGKRSICIFFLHPFPEQNWRGIAAVEVLNLQSWRKQKSGHGYIKSKKLADSILIPWYCKHHEHFKLPVKGRAFVFCTNYGCVVWRLYTYVLPTYIAQKIQPSPGTRRSKAARFIRSDKGKQNILCSC